MSIKVHAIQTGTVQIKANQIRRAENRYPALANLLFGRVWSPWLPIFTWLIEHPEGLFVVDTGDTAKTAEPGYLPRYHPYYRMAVRFQVTPEDEIGPQLTKHGWDPRQVKAVIMTHLHCDHAGGLHHFPQTDILVHPAEYQATKGIGGRIGSYLPHRWPSWFAPKLVSFAPKPLGPFPESYSLTKDGRILIVPTPGHSAGHMSVVVQADDVTYFLAGDASYREDLMVCGISDGVSTPAGLITLQRIQQFTQEIPTVFLPSHEPEGLKRLAEKQIVTAVVNK